ncbi:hypothetical protein H072_8420 [Dactylellina haptotyla CBS 200.50]|uniref:SHSP domain-containing protein n=1 Tax=Dactylellina haptotyla (strain CBS 200.50) TaxID=1284197 RepID=S8A590_DACHA|nr:hypothetical protein H072_8420 [Dactylellina haptotyla CBS 200.50]
MLSFPRMMTRELRPWARLFEDFEAAATHHPVFRSQNLSLTSFTPSFDVKETKDSYVLDGELPGITDKSALDLTFVDANTLLIKGRIERNNETGNQTPSDASETASTTNYRSPSVEPEEGGESSAVTKAETAGEVQKKEETSSDKYWIRERYVGEFQRAFNFPQAVNHDAVKASLKDGILSVVVPKKTGPDGPRKIQVE